MKLAIYPGSFDPITNGHLNLIERGSLIFDKLIVAVAHNVRKEGLFLPEERAELIREATKHLRGVEVDVFSGLLADYAKSLGARIILRGLRAVSDFEYEFQMAHINRRIGDDLETLFMMTGEEHFYVSSQLVREIAAFGGKISGLVPKHVEKRLQEKFNPCPVTSV